MFMLREANVYFSNNEPWNLKKSIRDGESTGETNQIRLDIVVYITLECVRIAGILLQPIIPTSADLLLTHIGVADNKRTLKDAETYGRETDCESKHGFSVGTKNFVLFDKKKTLKKIKEIQRKE
jgi:methionyl-tRNA synthetase